MVSSLEEDFVIQITIFPVLKGYCIIIEFGQWVLTKFSHYVLTKFGQWSLTKLEFKRN